MQSTLDRLAEDSDATHEQLDDALRRLQRCQADADSSAARIAELQAALQASSHDTAREALRAEVRMIDA